MAASWPHDLFVGEMGAKEPPNLHLPRPRLGQRGSMTWHQDTAGNWIRRRLEAAAAVCSETTKSRPAISSRATSPSKVSQNQEQLHRELLFTHRKGLNLRSKPELLQVLENRNRRRDGMESDLEQSPLEQQLLRWQQRRKQQHQQEETSNTVGNQPEFIWVRENLRRTYHTQDPPPQRKAPSPIASPFLCPHLTNRQPSKAPATHFAVVPQAEDPLHQGSLETSGPPSAPSQHPLANT